MKKCLICDRKSSFSKTLSFGKYRYLLCDYCNGGTLIPRKLALKEVKSVYDKKYFSWKKESGFKSILYKIRLFKPYPDWIEEMSKKKGKILDVGAGIPEFVNQMKERGWDPYALELSPEQSKKLKELLGEKKVYIGDFEKVKLPKNCFDVLTFWHVFEHVRFPQKTLTKTKEILKKGGLVFMEVPNFDSLNLKLFGKFYSLLSIPAHLFYYTEASLRKAYLKQEFRVLSVSYPLKYNSVFSASLSRYIEKRFKNANITNLIFYLSLPFSVLLSIFASVFGRSDIIRVVAKKD